MPFSGALGGMAEFGPLGSAFKGHGSRPRLNTYMCRPRELKDDICKIIFKKYMQILSCIGKLCHIFKQNVPQSESRQFDRLRLRLLTRCYDSA